LDGMDVPLPTALSPPVDGRFEKDLPTISPMPSVTPLPTSDSTIAVGTNSSQPDTSNTMDTMCGCLSCDESAWNSLTDTTTTCGDRISFVIGQGSTERAACILVAKEFPDVCDACNPLTCEPDTDDSSNNSTDLDTNTTDVDMDDNSTMADDDMMGESFCGCDNCTWVALDTLTDGNVTCADRLGFLLDQGTNETEACFIISDQFPDECGVCQPFTCGSGNVNETLAGDNETETTSTPTMAAVADDVPTMAPSVAVTATSSPTPGFTDRSSMPVQVESGAAPSMRMMVWATSGICMGSTVALSMLLLS
jgi:hypothetical protein